MRAELKPGRWESAGTSGDLVWTVPSGAIATITADKDRTSIALSPPITVSIAGKPRSVAFVSEVTRASTGQCLYRARFGVIAELHRRRLINAFCEQMSPSSAQRILRGRIFSRTPGCGDGSDCSVVKRFATPAPIKVSLASVSVDPDNPKFGLKLFATSPAKVTYSMDYDMVSNTMVFSLGPADWMATGQIADNDVSAHLDSPAHLIGFIVRGEGRVVGDARLSLAMDSLQATGARVDATMRASAGLHAALHTNNASVSFESVSVTLGDGVPVSARARGALSSDDFTATLAAKIGSLAIGNSHLVLSLDRMGIGAESSANSWSVSGALNITSGDLNIGLASPLHLTKGVTVSFAAASKDGKIDDVALTHLSVGISRQQTLQIGELQLPVGTDNGTVTADEIRFADSGDVSKGVVAVNTDTLVDGEQILLSTQLNGTDQPWIIRPKPRRLMIASSSTPLTLTVYYFPKTSDIYVDLAHAGLSARAELTTRQPEPTGTHLQYSPFTFSAQVFIKSEDLRYAHLQPSTDRTTASITTNPAVRILFGVKDVQQVAQDDFAAANHDGHCRAHSKIKPDAFAVDIPSAFTLAVNVKTLKFAFDVGASSLPDIRFKSERLTGCPNWLKTAQAFLEHIESTWVPQEVWRALKDWGGVPRVGM